MKRIVFFCFCLAFVALACDEVGMCKEEKYSAAIVDDFPDSLKTGVSQSVKIEYILENSCGSFVEFEETAKNKITEVRVKLLYKGCNCNQQFEEATSYYELKADAAGTYTYKFYLADSEYDTYLLEVYD